MIFMCEIFAEIQSDEINRACLKHIALELSNKYYEKVVQFESARIDN